MDRRKRRKFFGKKKCSFCSKKATTLRQIKNKRYLLCDDHNCINKWKRKFNIFNGIELEK